MADLVIGIATVLTSSLIYRKWHTKNGQYALLFGAIAWEGRNACQLVVYFAFFISIFGFDAILGMLKQSPALPKAII